MPRTGTRIRRRGQKRRHDGIAPRRIAAGEEEPDAAASGSRVSRRAHTTTSLGSSRTTASAISRALVRCETSRTMAPSSARARTLRHSRASVVGVEGGARLVERDHGPDAPQVAVEGAGDGDPLRLAAGESGALDAELERRGRGRRRTRGRARARPWRHRGRRRRGRRCRGCVPAMSPGCCPAHASQVDGVSVADVVTRRGRVAVELGGAAEGGEQARLARAARSLDEGDGARARR